MVSFFGSKDKSSAGSAGAERLPRHSSGWGKVLERMKSDESLRVLDVGPTSSSNINFITALGHSIYLANLVEDAGKREWIVPGVHGEPDRFDVDRFLASHLDFSGRGFDLVLFWDTADYLPDEVVAPVLQRLHEVMAPGGQMLMLFHSATGSSGSGSGRTDFCRYHLTNETRVEVQHAGDHPLLNTYTNRQVEKLLESFKGFHFFLSKDNVREVLVTR